jgi:hypothetical protein
VVRKVAVKVHMGMGIVGGPVGRAHLCRRDLMLSVADNRVKATVMGTRCQILRAGSQCWVGRYHLQIGVAADENL